MQALAKEKKACEKAARSKAKSKPGPREEATLAFNKPHQQTAMAETMKIKMQLAWSKGCIVTVPEELVVDHDGHKFLKIRGSHRAP